MGLVPSSAADGAVPGALGGAVMGVDSSFERQLYNDSPAGAAAQEPAIDLGPLWGVLAVLPPFGDQAGGDSDTGLARDALLRRLVRLGGATPASCKPAASLLQSLCFGDLSRSQAVVCRICERVEESDGRALRSALRAGTALVALSDGFVRERTVFLLKGVLHVARNNRRYFRTMHLVVHYLVKWCRRRQELAGWLLADGGGSGGNYRWVEAWLKECIHNGGDAWAGGSYGTDPGRDARWAWCSEVLPHVRRIVRGEAPAREANALPTDSDADLPGGPAAFAGRVAALAAHTTAAAAATVAPARRGAPPLVEPLLNPGAASAPQMELRVLSKAQMVANLVANQSRRRHDHSAHLGMRPLAAW